MPYEYECYQKDQLIKEMLLLENHLKTFKCSHCIRKHRLTIEALASETYGLTPKNNERILLKKIIRLPKDIRSVRRLRKQLMEITPNKCRIKVLKVKTRAEAYANPKYSPFYTKCKNKTC